MAENIFEFSDEFAEIFAIYIEYPLCIEHNRDFALCGIAQNHICALCGIAQN
jgi:hypothetical protein